MWKRCTAQWFSTHWRAARSPGRGSLSRKPGMTMVRGLVLVGEVAFYRERCQRPGDRPVSIGRPTSASDLADCFASVSETHVGA